MFRTLCIAFHSSIGWGKYQRHLAAKLGATYACLGADMLLPVFLAPLMQRDVALSPPQLQLLKSAWFVGAMIGFFLTGATADTLGRKQVLQLCAVARCLSTLSMGCMPSFGWVVLTRLISSIGASGAFNTLLPLLFEFSPPQHRSSCKRYLSLLWNVGVAYLCIGAWMFRNLNWRWSSLLFLPSIPITLMLFSNVMESPKYLLTRGKFLDAKNVLGAVANYNGVESSIDLDSLNKVIGPTTTTTTTTRLSFLFNYFSLFRPRILRNTCVLILLNFAVTSTYYGITLGDVSRIGICGNVYQQQLFASALEIPGLLFVVPLADSLGRKLTIILVLSTYAVSMVSLATLPEAWRAYRLVSYLLARMSGQAAYALKWIINAEAYPTSCRNAGLSLASIVGQLGGLLGPMLFLRLASPFRWFCALLTATSLVRNMK